MVGIVSSLMDEDLPEGMPRRRVAREELTSENLADLLNRGSPYLSRAQAEGEQYAARRGLINSTIAGQSAVGAAIDRALPIASADAQTFGRARSEQFDLRSRDYLMGKESQLKRGEMQFGSELERLNAEHANALRRGDMLLAHQLESQMARLQNELRQGDIRLSAEMDRLNAEHANALRRGDMVLANQLESQMARLQSELKQGEMRLAQEHERNMAGLVEELRRGTLQLQNRLGREATAEEIRLQTESRARLIEIENSYRREIERSQVAANVWTDAQRQIVSVLTDQNIPAANKQAIIDRIQDLARITLDAIRAAGGANLGEIIGGDRPPADVPPPRIDVTPLVPPPPPPPPPPPIWNEWHSG